MTREEFELIKVNSLVRMLDNRIGVLIRFPRAYDDLPLAGIQFPGEENISWVPIARLMNPGQGMILEVES